MDDLRRRLDKLRVGSRLTGRAPVRRARATPQPIEDVLGGCLQRCGESAFWRVETSFDDACDRHGLKLPEFAGALQKSDSAAPAAGLEQRRTIVIDIETGGFSGTEVFLIGFVPLDLRPLRVVQYLARDYPEEKALLLAMVELGQERDTWVSFNGKSFDEPFLQDRAARYHVRLERPTTHVDVLHAARRRWRGELPNCRLQTLEEHLLGWRRVGDVPGADIPDLFHHFIRTGQAAPVRPVLEHNQLDLISCTDLLLRHA